MGEWNYGRKYSVSSRKYLNKKTGVYYMPMIKYYIVRAKKNGVVTTLSKHPTRAEADKAYKKLKTL